MSLKQDKEVAQALTNLRGNPDFQQVLKWLADSRESVRDALEKTEDVQLAREQGKAQILGEFITAVREAPTITERLKQRER